jgi:hypothetical protein
MTKPARPARLCAALAFATAAACSAEAAAPAAAAPSVATPSTGEPSAAVPAGPRGVVLTRYESIRAALADDNGAAIAAHLGPLRAAVAALSADKGAGAGDLQKGLDGLAAAAAPKEGAAVDLKAARLAFGELSRGLVALVAADAALQAGRFLFECPMARGYQRWVQTTPQMKNPYMGKRMLECGSAVDGWRVDG